jgi:hypothetical protein
MFLYYFNLPLQFWFTYVSASLCNFGLPVAIHADASENWHQPSACVNSLNVILNPRVVHVRGGFAPQIVKKAETVSSPFSPNKAAPFSAALLYMDIKMRTSTHK